jgi:hypothetical protein
MTTTSILIRRERDGSRFGASQRGVGGAIVAIAAALAATVCVAAAALGRDDGIGMPVLFAPAKAAKQLAPGGPFAVETAADHGSRGSR